MADYKEYKNGITVCIKSGDLSAQKDCGIFIENKRTAKCVFEKWGWVCDCTSQTYQNVIEHNKRSTKKRLTLKRR